MFAEGGSDEGGGKRNELKIFIPDTSPADQPHSHL